jgi:hypothetical protein
LRPGKSGRAAAGVTAFHRIEKTELAIRTAMIVQEAARDDVVATRKVHRNTERRGETG